MNSTLQILTTLIALAAVIVGPLASIRIARRQIRASVVSANRQAWINSLRDILADFLSKHAMARNANFLSHADQTSLPRIEEIIRLNSKIEMMINPSETDHARLAELIGEMTNTINRSSAESKGADIDKQRKEVIALSQAILKREWDRVKRGD